MLAQSMPQTGKRGRPVVETTQQGAGLKMAAHPLLLDTTPAAPQSKKDRYKPMQPKFASIKVCTRDGRPTSTNVFPPGQYQKRSHSATCPAPSPGRRQIEPLCFWFSRSHQRYRVRGSSQGTSRKILQVQPKGQICATCESNEAGSAAGGLEAKDCPKCP